MAADVAWTHALMPAMDGGAHDALWVLYAAVVLLAVRIVAGRTALPLVRKNKWVRMGQDPEKLAYKVSPGLKPLQQIMVASL